MKYFNYLVLALFLLVGVSESSAQQRKFGLGVIIGEPTGLSMKLWTSPSKAIDAGLGWSISQNQDDTQKTRIQFHVDMVQHAFNQFNTTARVPLYYGMGLGFIGGSESESSLAIRGVLGLAWEPEYTPMDVFLEIVPALEIIPSTSFILNAGFGFRYFF
ncbi:MAG: hypothetical protein HQ507_13165 [Candidatus Marinimicrobia bacterium]|nr:hypothetical protein [Candidatus Neomarinimicrobiota bacterium]